MFLDVQREGLGRLQGADAAAQAALDGEGHKSSCMLLKTLRQTG